MNELWRGWNADYTIGALLAIFLFALILAGIVAVTVVELRKQR